MKFTKMHGAGNDYIFVRCGELIADMPSLTRRMSDRHYGVGGDGVVFLYDSTVADVKMRMFNADGSEGAICGNALRCIARLICDERSERADRSGESNSVSGERADRIGERNDRSDESNFASGENRDRSDDRSGESNSASGDRTGERAIDTCRIETNVGIVAVIRDGELFTVDMGQPTMEPSKKLSIGGREIEYDFVSVGNPHCVIFTSPSDPMEVTPELAESIQAEFEGGINVEFVTVKDNALSVRVFERGSGETLSCGSGACAVAYAAIKRGLIGSEVSVILKGGTLKVKYLGNIFLTGNAEKIYEGEYYDKVHFCDGRCGQRSR